MKANFVCFKISKTVFALLVVILFEIIFIGVKFKEIRESNNIEDIRNTISGTDAKEEITHFVENGENENNTTAEQDLEKEEIIIESKQEEYKDMPRELKGYKVIGKITIPKLKLNSYILEETNKKSLKVSVTKLYGPEINKIGNFCIAGHNYRNNKMFGGIKKLEEGDKIVLTDTFGRSVTYIVYANFQTSPKDVSCLNQDTQSEREVTLITCTAGAIKRVIVKAVEEYD